jgi:hypothetical protein
VSKSEILQELPKLGLEDRREILELICVLEEHDLLNGSEPSAAEKSLLDRELADYRQAPDAGSSWQEVQARLRAKPSA